MELSGHKDFISAVNEAQLLLAFATRNGMEIDLTVVKIIVASKEQVSNKNWDADTEANFWQSFRILAKLVQPVTVVSLQSTMETPIDLEEKQSSGTTLLNKIRKLLFRWYSHNKSASLARKEARRNRRLTMITMLFMLIVQVYWVIGSALISDTKKIPTEIAKKREMLSRAEDSLGDRAADSKIIAQFESDLVNLDQELNARVSVLVNWNKIWQAFPKIARKIFNKKIIDKPITDARMAFKLSIIKAQFLADGLQVYLLPLLYGLLGGFVYVLRRLSFEIKNLIYTEASNINFGLRLHLGALAGLAIGWFFEPDKTASSFSLSSLSPLALAFLAGYSVELLFTMMDKLISPAESSTKDIK